MPDCTYTTLLGIDVAAPGGGLQLTDVSWLGSDGTDDWYAITLLDVVANRRVGSAHHPAGVPSSATLDLPGQIIETIIGCLADDPYLRPGPVGVIEVQQFGFLGNSLVGHAISGGVMASTGWTFTPDLSSVTVAYPPSFGSYQWTELFFDFNPDPNGRGMVLALGDGTVAVAFAFTAADGIPRVAFQAVQVGGGALGPWAVFDYPGGSDGEVWNIFKAADNVLVAVVADIGQFAYVFDGASAWTTATYALPPGSFITGPNWLWMPHIGLFSTSGYPGGENEIRHAWDIWTSGHNMEAFPGPPVAIRHRYRWNGSAVVPVAVTRMQPVDCNATLLREQAWVPMGDETTDSDSWLSFTESGTGPLAAWAYRDHMDAGTLATEARENGGPQPLPRTLTPWGLMGLVTTGGLGAVYPSGPTTWPCCPPSAPSSSGWVLGTIRW